MGLDGRFIRMWVLLRVPCCGRQDKIGSQLCGMSSICNMLDRFVVLRSQRFAPNLRFAGHGARGVGPRGGGFHRCPAVVLAGGRPGCSTGWWGGRRGQALWSSFLRFLPLMSEVKWNKMTSLCTFQFLSTFFSLNCCDTLVAIHLFDVVCLFVQYSCNYIHVCTQVRAIHLSYRQCVLHNSQQLSHPLFEHDNGRTITLAWAKDRRYTRHICCGHRGGGTTRGWDKSPSCISICGYLLAYFFAKWSFYFHVGSVMLKRQVRVCP